MTASTPAALAELRITDVHVHIHPWREMRPEIVSVLRVGQRDPDFLEEVMYDPKLLLQIMDEDGVDRVGLVNYPSPDVMGTDLVTMTHAARYAEAAPGRMMWYAGVHPRVTRDPAGDVDALIEMGMRMLKVHPNHQELPANAYSDGLDAQARIYRRCEDREFRCWSTPGRVYSREHEASMGTRWRSTISRSIFPISASCLPTADVRSGWVRRSSSCGGTGMSGSISPAFLPRHCSNTSPSSRSSRASCSGVGLAEPGSRRDADEYRSVSGVAAE